MSRYLPIILILQEIYLPLRVGMKEFWFNIVSSYMYDIMGEQFGLC